MRSNQVWKVGAVILALLVVGASSEHSSNYDHVQFVPVDDSIAINPPRYAPASAPPASESTRIPTENDRLLERSTRDPGDGYFSEEVTSEVQGSHYTSESWWPPVVALMLPLVLGLGVIEATLLYTTIMFLAGAYKGRISKIRPWHPTVATVMALCWAVQMALIAGLLNACSRMRTMIREGSISKANYFSALGFDPQDDTLASVLSPIIFVTPVVAFCFWAVLTIVSKIKKARMSEINIAVISDSCT